MLEEDYDFDKHGDDTSQDHKQTSQPWTINHNLDNLTLTLLPPFIDAPFQ